MFTHKKKKTKTVLTIPLSLTNPATATLVRKEWEQFIVGNVKLFFNVMYSSSHLQAGASMINIHLTLCTDHNLCKNVSLAVLFGNNLNSYTISKHRYVFLYIHVFFTI